MISFELATQLKQSGYPQTAEFAYSRPPPLSNDPGNTVVGTSYEWKRWRVSDLESQRRSKEWPRVAIPTLSELIEACGKTYTDGLGEGELELYWMGNEWVAVFMESIYHESFVSDDGRGSTPEEAVARLWLALHANTDAGTA
jgi:hypothetical protein